MAVEPATPDLLARAVEQARRESEETTPPGWIELSDSIMSRVKTMVRPGEPLLVFSPDGEPTQDARGSRTYVSARIVSDALRRLLTSAATHAPERIDLEVEDKRLRGVSVALVASYGTPLLPLADALRAEVLDLLLDLLGPDPDLGPGGVEILVEDVVEGDPRQV